MAKLIVWNLQECMRTEPINDITQYEELINKYRQKGCLCNDYLQNRVADIVDAGKLYMACGDLNAFLFEQKAKCLRLYYYINSQDETFDFSEQSPIVTEIIYRGEKFFPQNEVEYFEKCDFQKNLIRDQYASLYKDLVPSQEIKNILVRKAITEEEVAWACNLFNYIFDVYSGDYIEETEIDELFANQAILIAEDLDGNKLGALHQTVDHNTAWISHVAVLPEARGKHVGQELLDFFVEINHKDEKSRYMLWVQKQNNAAVTMYQNKGFKYINKSTLSMILK